MTKRTNPIKRWTQSFPRARARPLPRNASLLPRPSVALGSMATPGFLRPVRRPAKAARKVLLDAAGQAGVKHLIHVSIVGLEHMRRMPYSRRKLEAEALVRNSELR
jgi:hypothetical protein